MSEEPTLPPDSPRPKRPGDHADDHPTQDLKPGPSSGTRRALELRDIPPRIGPYKVVRELGHGGMGSVILAIRDDGEAGGLQRHVAIKLIKRGMDSREILKRFELERKVIGSLSHPNIARVLDAGATDDGRPYFVMEYIQGQPIDEYCDSQQLTTRERLVLFAKVCGAVQYAHQNLIVHRDIKPGNLLVTPDGEPKLVDFGIAKMLNPDLAGFTLDTLPEARVMTPEYASPEQVRGEPISTASDIYSLGVLLYELLTGRRPYQIKSRVQAEIVRIVCEEEPDRPSTAVTRPAEIVTSDGTTRTITAEEIGRRREMAPTKLRRTLSGDVDNIVLMAMRKSPRRRYASAEQFAQDIANHLHNLPVIAAPETWHYHFSKFVARNKVSVAATLAVIFALGVGMAGTVWQRREALLARDAAFQNARLAERAEAATRAKYEQLRDFAGGFMAATETNIQRLEGATAARKVVVDTARNVLEKFTAEGADDPLLTRMLADMLNRLALVVGGGRTANEGSAQDAIAFFRKSIDLRRSLLKADPGNVDDPLELASSLEQLAFVLSRNGAPQEADLLLAESDSIAKTAVAASGAGGAKARRYWSRTLIARGDRAMQSNRLAEAEPLYREALTIIQALADAAPEGAYLRSDLQREVSVAHAKIGGWLDRSGNQEAALEAYQRSLAIREALFTAAPSNATNRRDVIVMGDKVARLFLRMNREGDAEVSLTKALAAADGYTEIDPDDKRFAVTAARLTELSGDIAGKRGDHEAAADRYTRFIARMHDLFGPTPESVENRYAIASVVMKLGITEIRSGKTADGVERVRATVVVYAEIADRDSTNLAMRLNHANAARWLGEKLLELGRADEAADPLTAAVASYQIADERKDGRPGLSPENRAGLAESLAALSAIAESQNAHARAVEYARRARDAAPAEPSDRVKHAIELARGSTDQSK